MQKRLFWIFFPMMFIPALLAMMIDWHNSREQLAILDGPGLSASFDASLQLARLVLETEKQKAHEQAVLLAKNFPLEIEDRPIKSASNSDILWCWAQHSASGEWNYSQGLEDVLRDSMHLSVALDPLSLESPVRHSSVNGSFLMASSPVAQSPDTWIVVAYPVSDELETLLQQVSRGSAGVRQLRFFYSRLLRSNLVVNLSVLLVLLLVISLVLSHGLSRYLARPLQELSRGTERVAAGDLTHRVQVKAPAEIGLLVEAFNRMTIQLYQGQEDLRRAEQIAAWQGVARRLAHEIKNPLTPITLAMHRIGKKSEDETIISCVDTVLEEAANLGRLADEFSLYAKLPAPKQQPVDAVQLRELLESLAKFYLERTRVHFSWVGWPASFTLFVDSGQLRQVLSNLIKNGNEAMEGQGTLTFEVKIVAEPGRNVKSDDAGSWVRLIIRDTGPGFADDPHRIFDPYVTSKTTGTGLGLAVARRIVEDNGGCLWAESSPAGAAFIIDLPDVTKATESSL